MSTTDPAAHSISPAENAAITGNLDEVADRSRAAAESSGRRGDDVRVLLATKTQPAEKIRVALEHEFTLIGENKVQEIVGKAEALADLNPETHLIGPLQRNKVNHTLRHAHCIQSVDTLTLAEKINNRLDVLDETVDYFIQVNTSREDSKFGVAPEDAEELITATRELGRMRLRGLMTIGLPGSSPEEIRPSYSDLRELSEKLRDSGVMPAEAVELSMGMSNDFELAIAEGATMVRVGSSVFGARDYS
ncbi:YggS family pyridoxal phosphate-dependent enzyme [Brevibacterium limosum]|uniref:YggS family pyridoxal phosphate-dependent enzyme n=1 Tax=Brevibacterium limosum TaxID=2697565 RepID=UPI00141D88A0|nr:YggS family pyridoxal phosphate-dependent enzyme [Brevibacterium limosum]